MILDGELYDTLSCIMMYISLSFFDLLYRECFLRSVPFLLYAVLRSPARFTQDMEVSGRLVYTLVSRLERLILRNAYTYWCI